MIVLTGVLEPFFSESCCVKVSSVSSRGDLVNPKLCELPSIALGSKRPSVTWTGSVAGLV